MYKVIDVAKMFAVSKVTIYKKISSHKAELKGHIIKKKNITFIDDEGVEIIKNSLQINKEKASGRLIDEELNRVYEDIRGYQDQNDKLRSEKIALLNEQIVDLESAVRHLKGQVTVKKNHYNAKDSMLTNLQDILKMNKERIQYLDKLLSQYETST